MKTSLCGKGRRDIFTQRQVIGSEKSPVFCSGLIGHCGAGDSDS